jgi:undecaprenyl-diphosphatase
MIELLKAALFGLVEGITEWLPISSTGHMLLLYELFHINEQDPFWSMFLVVIQLGAILAVVVLYFQRLWPFRMPDRGASGAEKLVSIVDREKMIMWVKIVISCIPAVIVGLTIDDWIEAHLYNYITVAVMLIVYGILFILVENHNRRKRAVVRRIGEISIPLAFLIGIFQALAIIPGTSRSGATILGGIMIGVSRTVAAQFTFILAIPVMFGASLLKVLKYEGGFGAAEALYLGTGCLVAFFVSVFAIKFLMGYIRKHDFKACGAICCCGHERRTGAWQKSTWHCSAQANMRK